MLVMAEINDPLFNAEASLLSAKFKLSPLEAKFLYLLITRRDAAKEDLPELTFAARQLIYTLRKKLYHIGSVYIANDGNGRYSIPKISKQVLREELRKP